MGFFVDWDDLWIIFITGIWAWHEFRWFSRKRRRESTKAWTDSSNRGFSTDSLDSEPRQKSVWAAEKHRLSGLKSHIFHNNFDYVNVGCVWISINPHRSLFFIEKWDFHVVILWPLQAWRKLMKNWWFCIDLRASSGGHETIQYESVKFYEIYDFDQNSLSWLNLSPSILYQWFMSLLATIYRC